MCFTVDPIWKFYLVNTSFYWAHNVRNSKIEYALCNVCKALQQIPLKREEQLPLLVSHFRQCHGHYFVCIERKLLEWNQRMEQLKKTFEEQTANQQITRIF